MRSASIFDLGRIVDDDHAPTASAIVEQTAQEGCLAHAKKTRKDGDRQADIGGNIHVPQIDSILICYYKTILADNKGQGGSY